MNVWWGSMLNIWWEISNVSFVVDLGLPITSGAFKVLLNVPWWSSVSSLFVSQDVATFGAVVHKCIFSLNNCICKTATSDSILAAFLNSDIFLTSKIVRKWHNLLYVHCRRSVTSWGCPHKLSTTFNISLLLLSFCCCFFNFLYLYIRYYYIFLCTRASSLLPNEWLLDWFVSRMREFWKLVKTWQSWMWSGWIGTVIQADLG